MSQTNPDGLLLLFSRQSGVLAAASTIIRLGAGGPYSHVDIVRPTDSTMPEYAHSILGATAQHGVDTAFIADRTGHKELRVWPDVDADAAWAWAEQQKGKQYDWLGALGVGARRDWQQANRYSCAELVVLAAIAGGAQIDPSQAWCFAPQHVLALTRRVDINF